jgi:hypothetical protein
MTPQSSFMVVAPVDRSRIAPLRELLATMNSEPGRVDPNNELIPFGQLETLHFARILILDDPTVGDIEVYNLPPPGYPVYLGFLGDFDGEYEPFLEDLIRKAGRGIARIFSFCDGFPGEAGLLRWMKENEHRPGANYNNWVGRTVRQTREEERLRQALIEYNRKTPELAQQPAAQIRTRLRAFVEGEKTAGRITLTSEPPTPFGWRVGNFLHAILMAPAILLAAIPAGILVLLRLRTLEKSDPEIAPRPERQWAEALSAIEDRGVTNQFSAMGTLKPGLFRRWIAIFLLWAIGYTTRHIYTRGRLARVHTIHFARWVFLDNKHRMFFASNYDGSLESYMDDFINKVAFGLNVVFSNGIGYPASRWLILDGAKDEQKFKYYIRRHELPTEIWYNAHWGLTATDLDRNSRIRRGLEAPSLSDEQAQEWLELL